MELGIRATKEAVELMGSIKTLDDLKAHKEELLSLIEDSIKHAVNSMKEIIKQSLSPEAIQQELAKLQDGQNENEDLGEKLDREIERIENLEGAEEYVKSLK